MAPRGAGGASPSPTARCPEPSSPLALQSRHERRQHRTGKEQRVDPVVEPAMPRQENPRVLHTCSPFPERLDQVPDLSRRRRQRPGQGAADRSQLRQHSPRSRRRTDERRPHEAADRPFPRLVGRNDRRELAAPEVLARVVRKGIAPPHDQEQEQDRAGREAAQGTHRRGGQGNQEDTEERRGGAPERRRGRDTREERRDRRQEREEDPRAEPQTSRQDVDVQNGDVRTAAKKRHGYAKQTREHADSLRDRISHFLREAVKLPQRRERHGGDEKIKDDRRREEEDREDDRNRDSRRGLPLQRQRRSSVIPSDVSSEASAKEEARDLLPLPPAGADPSSRSLPRDFVLAGCWDEGRSLASLGMTLKRRGSSG